MEEDCLESTEQRLKADRMGRVRTPPEQQKAMLEEFHRSGLSGARFAKLHGINYQTLMSWKRKHRREEPLTLPSGELEFVEVATGTPASHPIERGLRIELGAGVSLQLRSTDQIPLAARLIRELCP